MWDKTNPTLYYFTVRFAFALLKKYKPHPCFRHKDVVPSLAEYKTVDQHTELHTFYSYFKRQSFTMKVKAKNVKGI